MAPANADDRPGPEELAAIEGEFGLGLDWDRTEDEDLIADPDIAAMRASGLTPADRQARFERRIAGIYSRAQELPQLMDQIEAEAEDRNLKLKVNGSGVLTEISFRPPARGATAADLDASFARCYAEATREATAALTEELAGFRADTVTDDTIPDVDPVAGDGLDALERLFDDTLARAETTLQQFQRPSDEVPRR